jgi:hypothetical protein
MDWRTWLWTQLNVPEITALFPGGLHAAGSLKGAPDKKPFMVISLGNELPQMKDTLTDGTEEYVTFQEATIRVHDEPGSYLLIGTLLATVRSTLVGPVAAESAVACTWQGNSPELSDEFYRTITRTSSYRLVGRTT